MLICYSDLSIATYISMYNGNNDITTTWRVIKCYHMIDDSVTSVE